MQLDVKLADGVVLTYATPMLSRMVPDAERLNAGLERTWRTPVARQGVDRRLAAILSADIVGYSRLIGVDEAGKNGAQPRSLPRLKHSEVVLYLGPLAE